MNAVNPALMQRLFMVTGSAAGSEADVTYIVEADNDDQARQAFIDQARHDAEAAGLSCDREDDGTIIVYIEDIQTLSDALLRRVQYNHTRQTPEPGM